MKWVLLWAGCFCAYGQAVFDAASIKPHDPNDTNRIFPHFLPGGRFVSRGMPLRFVISVAYNVGFQSVRLSHGPDWAWAPDQAYDIEATASAGVFSPGMGSKPRAQRERQMLQALLADRFRLKIHPESKEMPVYALVVAKSGSRLDKSKIEEKDCGRESATVSCHTIQGGRGRGLHGEAVTLDDIASYVENWTDRPLLNKTGIAGLFNVQTSGWLDLQPGPPPPGGAKGESGAYLADMPTLPQVFDKLGLKMEQQRAKVEVFVIDNLARPTAN